MFLNPQTQLWETEDHYLSGDVRDKLQIAEAASLTEPRYQENVAALKSVQPEDLSATQIDARLGACWLPVKDFEKFARELLGADYGEGKYDDAATIFADMVNNDTFVEFLTLPAYERID